MSEMSRSGHELEKGTLSSAPRISLCSAGHAKPLRHSRPGWAAIRSKTYDRGALRPGIGTALAVRRPMNWW